MCVTVYALNCMYTRTVFLFLFSDFFSFLYDDTTKKFIKKSRGENPEGCFADTTVGDHMSDTSFSVQIAGSGNIFQTLCTIL